MQAEPVPSRGALQGLQGSSQGWCQAARCLKVPKEAWPVILLIQEFLSLGSVVNDAVNEKEGDPTVMGIPAPTPQ